MVNNNETAALIDVHRLHFVKDDLRGISADLTTSSKDGGGDGDVLGRAC